MKQKTCLIFVYAPHYREAIFKLLDKTNKVDFYFGDKMDDIKRMDYALLSNFKKELVNVRLFHHFYWQKGVVRLLRKKYNQYLVTGEYYCLSTWALLFLCKFSSKKIYLWSHGWYGKEPAWQKPIKKLFFALSDGVFLQSDHAKKLMVEHGLNEKKLHVFYNSLDYDQQKEIRKNLKNTDVFRNHFKNDGHNLIFVGRLTKVKQLDMLLQALAELNKQDKQYNLTLVGSGEMEQPLLELAKQMNIENRIWFYGAIHDELELSELIYNADLCVSPGNVGLTAMHALAYGCPVISHDNFAWQMPEFEAIEKNKTGDFFKHNDIPSLVETIENWFRQNLNREAVRENCYEIIDAKYNPNYQMNIIKQVLFQ